MKSRLRGSLCCAFVVGWRQRRRAWCQVADADTDMIRRTHTHTHGVVVSSIDFTIITPSFVRSFGPTTKTALFNVHCTQSSVTTTSTNPCWQVSAIRWSVNPWSGDTKITKKQAKEAPKPDCGNNPDHRPIYPLSCPRNFAEMAL